MTEAPHTEDLPIAVRVVNPPTLPKVRSIDGSGFTLRVEANDGPQRLLSEDPNRIRAVVTSNVGAHVGSKQSLSTVSGVIPVNTNTPGVRVDSTSGGFEIFATSEVWVAVEAAGLVSVWIEREND